MKFGTVATAALLVGGCTGRVGGTFSSMGGSAGDAVAGVGGNDASGGLPGAGGTASAGSSGSASATSGSSESGGEAGQASDSSGGTGAGGVGGTGAGGVGGTDITGTGLWCDVQRLLHDRCWSCHAAPLAMDVPMALVTAEDLAAASMTDPTASNALLSLGRMQNPVRPMPPKPATPATAEEIQLMKDWIDAGMPSSCDSGSGGTGVVPDPYDTPVTCSSDKRWTRGDAESPLMHPGGACIDCHSSGGEEEGPVFAFAGTVYPTAHEPTDCNGMDGTVEDVKVVILDANDKTYTLDVNAAGNFFFEPRGAAVAMPYRAKVVRGTLERLMPSEQTDGDCNLCHTEGGAKDAPGRIMAP